LGEASSALTQKIYAAEQAGKAEGTEKTQGESKDDDVVDAEFEEVKDEKK
jgi:molecular chaperone DnaK